jgi:putative endonuclease
MPTAKKQTGNQGEQLAARFLEQNGYAIVETNWHCTGGELDIVARKDDTLVFVEVKTCRGETVDAAFMQITPAKRRRLVASAYAYVHTNQHEDLLWRIDVIGIALPLRAKPIIEHMEDALDW